MSGLTPEQVRLFRHNGFLKLPGRLDEETVDRLKATILRDIEQVAEPVVRDPEGRVVRISVLLDRDPLFMEAATHPEVLGPLRSLLGEHIAVVTNRHNHATLNKAATRPDNFHRDTVQWSRGLVTVIFYLEQTTLENGCTMVIPGTHMLPGIDYLHDIKQTDWIDESGLLHQGIPVPMPAGGLLAIDSTIFHRIGTNTTNQTRMSMTLGYQSVDELAAVRDPTKRLVSGDWIYMGNDKRKVAGNG